MGVTPWRRGPDGRKGQGRTEAQSEPEAASAQKAVEESVGEVVEEPSQTPLPPLALLV